MKVILRNPRREVEVRGGRRVKDVLGELGILPETVLVIRGDTLATADQVVADDETLELRPVMSGGSGGGHGAGRSRQQSRALAAPLGAARAREVAELTAGEAARR